MVTTATRAVAPPTDFPSAGSGQAPGAAELYLDVLKRALVNWHYADTVVAEMKVWSWRRRMIAALLRRFGLKACVETPIPLNQLTDGKGMHTGGYTLVGIKRLDNVQRCIMNAVRDGVPGDLIECGVWRGGTCIFMRGVLKALGVTDRKVWVADSFRGLPPPNPEKYPADADEWMHRATELAISQEQVRANFTRFDMLDDQVGFIEGYFSETLHKAPIERLAVLRLDGDMYESTMDTLLALYPKLSPGGYVIVDDYQRDNCKQAVIDYRKANGIEEPIEEIDWVSAFWRKEGQRSLA